MFGVRCFLKSRLSRGQWSPFFAFQIVITSADPCERTPLSFKIFSVVLTISALGKTIDSPLLRVSNSKVTNSSFKSRRISTR